MRQVAGLVGPQDLYSLSFSQVGSVVSRERRREREKERDRLRERGVRDSEKDIMRTSKHILTH